MSFALRYVESSGVPFEDFGARSAQTFEEERDGELAQVFKLYRSVMVIKKKSMSVEGKESEISNTFPIIGQENGKFYSLE